MNTNDRIARIAMWPPVMLAASRIVSANGRTNMPMISMRNQQRDHGQRQTVRHQVLPVLNEAVRREPAMMIVKNVIVASAAVTL